MAFCPTCGQLTSHVLSPRERQVLVLAAGGLSAKAIGAKLGISPQTVKCVTTQIFQKLHVADRTAAVVLALRQEILSLDEIDVEMATWR